MTREELIRLLREDPEVRAALQEALQGVRPRPLEVAARGIAEALAEAEREWLRKQEARHEE
ncbi:hypothetical protein [Thermus hydrothermalis]|uniref:hypothetical protein n=1 Tax=Thermus hydrothermalis TaxID=2908148 RepID=UPI001FAB10D2|nr:hypothetical protein [Thermus hydrothermalis]